jgi:hypothetical protein
MSVFFTQEIQDQRAMLALAKQNQGDGSLVLTASQESLQFITYAARAARYTVKHHKTNTIDLLRLWLNPHGQDTPPYIARQRQINAIRSRIDQRSIQ